MPLNNATNLFLYELASMYDAERKSGQLLADTVGQVQDSDLARILQDQQQESQEKVNNLEACFRALGIQPQAVPCSAIDGMRTEFETFANQQPSPDVWQMYTLGAAMKLSHFGIASYRELVDKAMLMGETECAQMLQTNLVQKEASAGQLERLNHEVSQRVLTPI
jgi:ferritin-like metal-binding protein YciE